MTRAHSDDLGRDHRVKMEMLVRVDVIEHEACRAKCVKLRLDLGAELPPHLPPQHDVEAQPRHVGAKESFRVNKSRHALGRPHG